MALKKKKFSLAMKYLLPSFIDILMMIVFIFVLAQNYITPNFFLNSKTGQLILETKKFIFFDPFSFTKANIYWLNHQWLGQIVLYLTHLLGSFQLVLLLKALMTMGIVYLLYQHLIIRKINIFSAVFFTFIGFLIMGPFWLNISSIFSCLIFILIYITIENFYLKRTNSLWALPLLMLFWVNINNAYIIGLLYLTIVYLTEAFKNKYKFGLKELEASTLAHFSKYYLVSILACFINPYSFEGIYQPLKEIFYPISKLALFFGGNFNFNFLILLYVFFFILIMLYSKKEKYLPAIMVNSIFMWVALANPKNIPFFVITSLPFLAIHFQQAVNDFSNRTLRKGFKNIDAFHQKVRSWFSEKSYFYLMLHHHLEAHTLLWIVIISAVLSLYLAPLMDFFNIRTDLSSYPVQTIKIIKKQYKNKNILTTPEWGSYLIYHLYPRNKIFIDTRHTFYKEVNQEYQQIISLDHSWEKLLVKHKTSLILLPKSMPLNKLLAINRKWRKVYEDEKAVIFRSIN